MASGEEEKQLINLYNENFEIIEEEGLVYLRHEKWPILTGVGEKLIEAEIDLLQEANEIAEAYLREPEDNLSKSSLEMRDFLLKIIG